MGLRWAALAEAFDGEGFQVDAGRTFVYEFPYESAGTRTEA
jgi:hypothetical protein